MRFIFADTTCTPEFGRVQARRPNVSGAPISRTTRKLRNVWRNTPVEWTDATYPPNRRMGQDFAWRSAGSAVFSTLTVPFNSLCITWCSRWDLYYILVLSRHFRTFVCRSCSFTLFFSFFFFFFSSSLSFSQDIINLFVYPFVSRAYANDLYGYVEPVLS